MKGKKVMRVTKFVERLQPALQLAGNTRQIADCEIYCNISFNQGNFLGFGTMSDAKKNIFKNSFNYRHLIQEIDIFS
jgi:hypothetical protein